MINKNDIVFSIIGFIFVSFVCFFCFNFKVEYECPSPLYTLENKTCIIKNEFKYSELKCSNGGYFNGSRCVNIESSVDVDLDYACELDPTELASNSRILDSKLSVENNNCVYNIIYVPNENVSCPEGFTLDNTTFRCKKEIAKQATQDLAGNYQCGLNEELKGDKCVSYQFVDPTVDKCNDENDALINNKCNKKYIDEESVVCEEGSYLDNACKVVGNNLYSICPSNYIDTGYSCLLNEIIEATRK